MPIYPYGCRDCGRVFDELRPIHARDDKAICPSCVSENALRSVAVPFAHRAYAAPADQPGTMGDEAPVNATLTNVTVENCQAGMKFDGVKIRGCDWTFKDNGTNIDANNSDVEVGGNITIE